MDYFQLSAPDYPTDQANDAANPIVQTEQLLLPGLICGACGQKWAGSRRLYLGLTKAQVPLSRDPRPLPEAQWRAASEEVRRAANLPSDFYLVPGDEIGAPAFEVKSTQVNEVMHPFPGTLVVLGPVAELVLRSRFTGVRCVPAEAHWSARLQRKLGSSVSPPTLTVLHVTGAARTVCADETEQVVCHVCRRRKSVAGSQPVIDVRTWDGTDFFHLNDNPNRVYVTGRVADAFMAAKVANVQFLPVASSG